MCFGQHEKINLCYISIGKRTWVYKEQPGCEFFPIKLKTTIDIHKFVSQNHLHRKNYIVSIDVQVPLKYHVKNTFNILNY